MITERGEPRFIRRPVAIYARRVTYDRRDAREAQRNALAVELAEARRKLGVTGPVSRGATRPIVLTVALVAMAPVLVGVARRGPEQTWRDVRSAAMQTRTGREMFDTPPVVDPASETLTVGPAHVTLGGHDAEGDPLTVILVSAPVHGTLTRLDGTRIADRVEPGEVIYVPDEGFVGVDRFEVAVDDGTLRSAVSRRSVRVYEQPTAVAVVPRDEPPELTTQAPQRTSVEVTVEYLRRHQRALEVEPAPEPDRLLPPLVTNADIEAGRGR